MNFPLNDTSEEGFFNDSSYDNLTLYPYEEDVEECGGQMSEHYWRVWSLFVYWCEGVLMVPIGAVGALGNVLSIIVLSSK